MYGVWVGYDDAGWMGLDWRQSSGISVFPALHGRKMMECWRDLSGGTNTILVLVRQIADDGTLRCRGYAFARMVSIRNIAFKQECT